MSSRDEFEAWWEDQGYDKKSSWKSVALRAWQASNKQSQDKCVALAAENTGMKELIEQHAGSIAVCPNCSHEEPSETDDIVALYRSMKTPATDAFLAEVRAQGVEMFAREMHADISEADAIEFAAKLRQEAAQ